MTATATPARLIVSAGRTLPKHRPAVELPAKPATAVCSKHDHYAPDCRRCHTLLGRTIARIDRERSAEIARLARTDRYGR